MTHERRAASRTEVFLNWIMPLIFLSVLSWVGLEVVSMKVGMVEKLSELRTSIDNVRHDLHTHNEAALLNMSYNALRHHQERMQPCNGCHPKRRER